MSEAPVRIGVIGLGRAFTLMLPTFLADPRVRLVAACDPREAPRQQFLRDFGGHVWDTAEALCADSTVELVYVASPHQLHMVHTALAARHGKHVLVEKPMALSLEDCDRMIQTCASAGVHLIVGHCHSFNTPYLRTRELVQSGRYGQVRMIHAMNYTDFLYRPRRPEELQTEEGGGVVFSQAAHQIDIVRLLALGRIVRVRAITGRWDETRPTEGAYAALLWFDNGCFANLVYSGYAHFDSDAWCGGVGEMGQARQAGEHQATRARLSGLGSAKTEAIQKARTAYGGDLYRPPDPSVHPVAHQHFGPIIVTCEQADLCPLPDAIHVHGNQSQERLSLARPHIPRAEVIDELVLALRSGKAPLHNGPWARETIQACLALLRSAELGEDVELQPDEDE